MKKYWSYFITSFKSESAYKADFFLSMMVELVFFTIYFTIWKTIYTTGNINQIDNYTLSSTITYYFISSLIYRIDISEFLYMNYSIWTGYFTNDLTKPWSAKSVDAIVSIADIILNFLLYIPLILFMLIFVHSYIQVPTAINLLMSIVTIILSIGINLMINLCLHSLCFYFGDQSANIDLATYLIAFLAGGAFPLAFLPSNISKIFYALPFRFLFDVPINAYLGKISSIQMLSYWGQMLIWIAIFYFAYRLLFNNGLKRYSGTGK